MNEFDRLTALRALGMDKKAEANLLGAGPAGDAKKATMTKTGPLTGAAADRSLMGYTRNPSGKMPQASVNVQNAKKPEEEQEETQPGVEKLESDADTPPKKAPEKKPEEPSENEVEKKAYSISFIGNLQPGALRWTEKKAVTFPIGTIVGALHGMGRKKEPDEDRLGTTARGALTGLSTDIGALAGAMGGTYGGAKLGDKLLGERTAFEGKDTANKRQLLQLLLGLAGTAGGGYLGYRLARRSPKSEKSSSVKKAAYGDERKGMGTTSKMLIGALAGAGLPMLLYRGSGPAVRGLLKKIYDFGILKKMHSLPSQFPRLAKGLSLAPAGIGAIAGGLSGGGEEDEFKLSSAGVTLTKAAVRDMNVMDADKSTNQLAGATAREDLIPYLGPLGGKVLGGLGSLTSGLGLEGAGSKLKEWSENPTARAIAGGGTTAIAALIAALAARRMMRGGQDEYED